MLKNPISIKSDFDPNLISLNINEYLEKYQFDTYDYVKTMEFIIDIKTKNMIK